MLGYVTIEVEGKDMDSASRQANRLANQFIEDLDNMARNSRMADRRAMSHFEMTNNFEERAPSVLRTVRYSPSPMSRLSSVPPAPISGYRASPVITNGISLPPRYPHRAGSVVHSYSTATRSVDAPYLYSSSVRRVSRSPSLYNGSHIANGYMTPTSHGRYFGTRTPVMSSSYSDLSSLNRARLERKLNDLLEYKLPSAEYYLKMKGSLRNLNEKMLLHKQLLDRYSGIDIGRDHDAVTDRVDQKYNELVARMPEIEGFRSRGPSMNTSRSETHLYYQSPKTVSGYGQGIVMPSGGQTSELRGRIKRLLCRSKQDPHYFRYRPNDPL